jgi:hypothetical protein
MLSGKVSPREAKLYMHTSAYQYPGFTVSFGSEKTFQAQEC